MSLLKSLARGEHGLVVVPPSHLVVDSDTDDFVALNDPTTGLGWLFYFFPNQRLDLTAEHAPLLDRDVRRHTRQLFEVMFAHDTETDDLPPDLRPRTADPEWTPLIETETVKVDGGSAFAVLHRMQYRPSRESVMGHTLVPVASGLFEARWMAIAAMTGLRESVLSLKRPPGAGFPDVLPQSAFDDPAHDAAFPDHPLSLARAAKRWHEVGTLRVTEPPPASPTGEVRLASLGCAVTMPSRFVLNDTFRDPRGLTAMFDRTSFSGTDGVDRLLVTRTTETLRAFAVARRLVKLAENMSRAELEQSGLWGVTCDVTPLDTKPPAVTVVTEGDSRQDGVARNRRVWHWFVDDSGQVWTISNWTSVAVPIDELKADVTAVAHSWRRLS